VDHFFGRQEELRLLISAWENVKAGNPHAITLIADTGVGKTRLAQAFYEHLAAESHKELVDGATPYWPSDLGAGRQRVANPSLERFGEFNLKVSSIPWLWWGMYWTDDPNDVTNGLAETSRFLRVHLEMLQLNDQCDRSSLEKAAGVASDYVVELAGLIPVVGQLASSLVSIAKLSRALYDNRRKRNEASAGHRERQANQLEAVVDELLLGLERQFASPKGVPMVLFMDDVHFATDAAQDEKTLQFLDRLMHTAVAKAWPILVVATHWKAPWQSHKAANPLIEAKPWRRILTDLVESLPAGRLLHEEVHLKPLPEENLAEVARDYLPGLSNSNLTAILQRVDNVRWLAELLRALADYSEHFENHDLGRALSPLGLRRLEGLLKQQGYLDVIRQRLMGEGMRNTRAVLAAMAWHARGLEFVSPLAGAFEERLVAMGLLDSLAEEGEQRIATILRQALDPAALIEGEAIGAELPDVVRFPERGYLEVSKSLLDEDCMSELTRALGVRLLEWMRSDLESKARWQQWDDNYRQKAFLGIAVEVLGRLRPVLSEAQTQKLAIKEASLEELVVAGDITATRKAEVLEGARELFLAEASTSTLKGVGEHHALAIAELCGLLFEEGQGQAWSLALYLAEHPNFAVTMNRLSKAASNAIQMAWQSSVTCWPQLRIWLQHLLDAADDVSVQMPESLWRKATNLLKLADLNNAAGDTPRARDGYEASLAIVESFLSSSGETSWRLREKAVRLERLADLDRDASETARARGGYENCLAIWERLVSTYGEKPGDLQGKAVLLERLADLDRTAGETARARNGYEASLSIRKRLMSVYGETPANLRGAIIPQERLADLDRDAGDFGRARERYEASLAIWEHLLLSFGEAPYDLRGKTVPLERLADLDCEVGETARARERYEASLEIRERLLSAYGETPDRLRDKTIALERLADLDREANETARALDGYKSSLAIWERLLSTFGATPSDLRCTSILLQRVADMKRDAGETAQARDRYEASLEILERLLSSYGETPKELRCKAVILERLADLDRDAHETALARLGYEASLAIWERLLLSYGETPRHLRGKTFPLGRLADLDRDACEIERAREGYETSLAIWERLLLSYGETPGDLRGKIFPLQRLADLDRDAGETGRARERYEESLAIFEQLQFSYGEMPSDLQGKIFPLQRLAELDRDAGETGRAREGYEAILAIWERLLSSYGETTDRLREAMTTMDRMAHLDLLLEKNLDARTLYNRCLILCENAKALQGETAEFLTIQAGLLTKIAALDAEAGDATLAQDGASASVAICERVAETYGDTRDCMRTAMFAAALLASQFFERSAWGASREKILSALSFREQLASRYGDSFDESYYAVILGMQLAEVEVNMGDALSARQRLEEAAMLNERVASNWGETPNIAAIRQAIDERLDSLDQGPGL
jgi:tetratricopeptide (TPR) repeat protein